MAGTDALAVLRPLAEAAVDVWLDGGWAVDAAIRAERRTHDDLDLVVSLDDVEPLERTLGALGYTRVYGEPPASFELVDDVGRQIDVHPVALDEAGDGWYVMENGGRWVYPARGFAGLGRIGGTAVRCLTPEVQLLCHTGYEPHLASYDDVWALGLHFGLAVPDAYRAPRETYLPRTA